MDFDNLDTDQLKEMKDTVANAVNQYAEERREEVEELAEYGGGGPEGYKFAAHALRQEYDEAAAIVDEDAATVEQDVGHIVDGFYDDAQKGREQASTFVEEALDIASPVIDAARNDPSSIPEAAEEAYQDAQKRLTEYAIESALKQAEADLEDMLGELDSGDAEEALGDMLDGLEGGGEDLGDLFEEPDGPNYEQDEAAQELDRNEYEEMAEDVDEEDDPSYESDDTSDADDADEDVEDELGSFPTDPLSGSDEDTDDDEE